MLGEPLDRVVKKVRLVIVDCVAALLRGGMVHKLGQAVRGVALRHKVVVLAENKLTGNMEGS